MNNVIEFKRKVEKTGEQELEYAQNWFKVYQMKSGFIEYDQDFIDCVDLK